MQYEVLDLCIITLDNDQPVGQKGSLIISLEPNTVLVFSIILHPVKVDGIQDELCEMNKL